MIRLRAALSRRASVLQPIPSWMAVPARQAAAALAVCLSLWLSSDASAGQSTVEPPSASGPPDAPSAAALLPLRGLFLTLCEIPAEGADLSLGHMADFEWVRPWPQEAMNCIEPAGRHQVRELIGRLGWLRPVEQVAREFGYELTSFDCEQLQWDGECRVIDAVCSIHVTAAPRQP